MSDAKQIMRMFKAIARARLTAQEMREFGNIVVEEKKKQFQRGESADGTEKWRPLETATILRKMGAHKTSRFRKGEMVKGKVKRYGTRLAQAVKKGQTADSPQSPLIDTGQMRDMYITEATKDHVVVSMAKSRSTGVSSGGESIAEIHEKGLGKGNKPRRHIGIPIAARKRIEEQFLRKINQTIRNIVDAHK